MLSARAVFGPGQIETPSGIVSGVSEISFVLGWAWMPFLQFYPLFVASRPSDVFGDGMKNP